MDAEATIEAIAVAADCQRAIAIAADRRRASARERAARSYAKKKEARHVADMIRERKAIAIAADRRRASAHERAARSYAKKKENVDLERKKTLFDASHRLVMS